VRIENGGNFFAGSVADGFVEVAGDGSSIFAFEVDIVDLGEAELGDEGVVGFGEASEIGSIRKKISSGRSSEPTCAAMAPFCASE